MSKSSLAVGLLAVAIAIAWVEFRLQPAETGPTNEPVDAAALEERIVSRLEKMLDERDERRVEPPPSSPGHPAVSGREPAAPPAPAVDEPASSPVPKTKRAEYVNKMLAKLRAGRFTTEDIDKLWDTLSGSGLEDEAVAAFQEYLKDHGDDADGWYGLGVSITSKFMGGAVSQMEIMKLSSEADRAFTKALEIDDDHFSARFSKAISYTFYPAIAGKSPAAIKHFETLVERHGTDTSIGEMAEVYFNLGNEYLKIGNVEKARSAYQNGVRYFPDSRRMRDALEAMEKK